jgi:tRNA pseudouridine55 synthase
MMKRPFPDLNIPESLGGILLVDKPKGFSSFKLVQTLRRRLGIQKIGHAGTLDPFATGVMVMLIGRRYTRLSDQFLCNDKEYLAEICLGITTDTYDSEGVIIAQSSLIPTLEQVQQALALFQGEMEQVPPMYSAKKVQGKKLYELARKGIEIERKPVKITLTTQLLDYQYPKLELRIACSKGTYIRSIAYDLGLKLGCGAHLANLRRTRSGKFYLEDCISEAEMHSSSINLCERLLTERHVGIQELNDHY